MARNLYINIIPEEPVTEKKDGYHQDTMRFEQVERVPENIRVRGFQLPLQKCAYRVIYSIPEAQQQISPLPNPWYIVNKFQAAKFAVKLMNEKEKRLTRANSR